jgi:hypothetical protein
MEKTLLGMVFRIDLFGEDGGVGIRSDCKRHHAQLQLEIAVFFRCEAMVASAARLV